MKTTFSRLFAERPVAPALMAIFAVGLTGSFMVSMTLYIVKSQIGRVVIFLAKLGFKLIPPALWIGAVLIVALWLAVLRRAWRQ